jgi:hypothetical protein
MPRIHTGFQGFAPESRGSMQAPRRPFRGRRRAVESTRWLAFEYVEQALQEAEAPSVRTHGVQTRASGHQLRSASDVWRERMHRMTRSRKLIWGIVGVAAGSLMWCGYTALASLDGFFGVIGSVLETPDTQYSARYSDRGFRAIRVGMSRHQVVEQLGPPLEQFWDYGCYKLALRWDGRVTQSTTPACATKRLAGDPTITQVLRT